MTIGIASPFSSGCFLEYLNESSQKECVKLSSDCAPAVTTLAKEFLRIGYRVIIFTLDAKASKYMTLYGENLVIHVAPSFSANRWKRLFDPFIGRNIRLIRKLFGENSEKIDVISVHWTRDYAIASKRYIGQIPVFVTVRDIIPYILKKQRISLRIYNWWIIYLMNEWVMRNNDYRFIANSEYTAAMIRHYWKKDVPIIPNPILDCYFSLENHASAITDQYVLSTISMSQPNDKRKNILTLLKAFKLVRAKKQNIILNLIGQTFTKENPQIIELEKQGFLDGVVLCGSMKHDKVLDVLCETHLMVHPSHEETFGNTLIEAMAVGCPILGGINSGAVPYVLNHGEAGYLCDVSQAEELANSILKIIDNPALAFEKAKKAKIYCRKKFSSEKIAEEYIQQFRNSIK